MSRRDDLVEVVYRSIRQFEEGERIAKGLRDALNGRGPRIKRGTRRPALAILIADAILAAERPGGILEPDEASESTALERVP